MYAEPLTWSSIKGEKLIGRIGINGKNFGGTILGKLIQKTNKV